MNNRVSQSVPHLHVSRCAARRKDGLKGFFWRAYKYKSDEEVLTVQTAIKNADRGSAKNNSEVFSRGAF
jgi:histidine triad (HIT) family protein